MSAPANTLGLSTNVGGQGSVNLNYGSASTAPGAQGPVAYMSVTHSALVILFGSMGALIVMGYLFRKGPIQ
jgi:hypothetical protein